MCFPMFWTCFRGLITTFWWGTPTFTSLKTFFYQSIKTPEKNEWTFQMKKWAFVPNTGVWGSHSSSAVFLGSNAYFLMGDTHFLFLCLIFLTDQTEMLKKKVPRFRKWAFNFKFFQKFIFTFRTIMSSVLGPTKETVSLFLAFKHLSI